MSHEYDQAYFARRCDEETSRGDAAATPAIADIHYDLAHRYALLCDEHPLENSVINEIAAPPADRPAA